MYHIVLNMLYKESTDVSILQSKQPKMYVNISTRVANKRKKILHICGLTDGHHGWLIWPGKNIAISQHIGRLYVFLIMINTQIPSITSHPWSHMSLFSFKHQINLKSSILLTVKPLFIPHFCCQVSLHWTKMSGRRTSEKSLLEETSRSFPNMEFFKIIRWKKVGPIKSTT